MNPQDIRLYWLYRNPNATAQDIVNRFGVTMSQAEKDMKCIISLRKSSE